MLGAVLIACRLQRAVAVSSGGGIVALTASVMLDLHAAEPADWDEPEHALHVLGRRGEYYLELVMPDESRFEFHDPDRPDGTVAIWESDQGWDSAPTRILCHDRQLLRRIVRHFVDTGQPLAEVRWRPAE
jgi:hypothetical protein